MITVYVSKNENGKWDVYVSGKSMNDLVNLPYTAAMSRAKDLLNKNGGGDIIVEENGKEWLNP